jgi:hypothetical protein
MLRSTGWVSLGVLLGTAVSVGIFRPPAELGPLDPGSLAIVTVLMMLAGTLRGPWGSPPGLR